MNARYIISLKTGEKHGISMGESLVVGRGPKVEGQAILLEQQGSSRDHGIILWKREGLFLTDQGSKNGTSVNGKPLAPKEEHHLQDGDHLSFAGEEFLVSFGGEEKSCIDLGGLYGQIEEIGGKRSFSILLENSGIYEYEKQILSAGHIKNALQVAFVMLEGKEKIFYDFTGYCQLGEYLRRASAPYNQEGEDRLHLNLVMDILLNILHAIKACEEHLFLADRIPMGLETIFIHTTTNNIAFAFIPTLAGHLSPQERLTNLLDQMMLLYDNEETRAHLKNIEEKIRKKNPGIDGIMTMAAAMQREMNFNYWTRQGLRKTILKETEKKEEVGEDKNTETRTRLHLHGWWRHKKGMLVIAQIPVAMGLATIYMTEILKGLDFFGFIAIVAGIDLWLVKGLKKERTGNERI